jgi:pimeloyl-ACP methyl ester carboxylesterase
MAVNHIHFFHGFLGEPKDWKDVIAALDLKAEIHNHSLLDDFKGQTFSQWAQMKKKQRDSLGGRHFFVGYSLGGRLLMHLDLESSDKVLLIGSHPGLIKGHENRLSSDQGWIERSQELSPQAWLKQWNDQEVFQKDRRRPVRNFDRESFLTWMKILSQWSLSKQECRDSWFKQNSSQVYWCCGENDKKFEELKKMRLQPILPSTHLFSLPGAGHGVIFDSPGELARVINKVFIK